MTELVPDLKLDTINYSAFEQKLLELAKTDWKKELKRLNFKGNIDNGAALIDAFVGGMREDYKLKKNQRKIPKDFVVPELKFEVLNSSSHAHSTDWGRTIVLNVSALENSSKESVYSVIELASATPISSIAWDGTLRSLYISLGAEEMNHSIDSQRDPNSFQASELIDQKDPDEVSSLTSYDSSDYEYRGLGSKIHILKKIQAPKSTLDVLMNRIKLAAGRRKKIRNMLKGY